MMATSNVCLGCKFSSVKLEILVPESSEIDDFVRRTQDFAAKILSITREKPLHYSLKYGSPATEGEMLNFTVFCSCTLNLDAEECMTYKSASEAEVRIKQVQYSKLETPEEMTIEL